MQYERRPNNQGFTLVELMIVVAIIGILAAIAVPNFIAYKNKARIAEGVGTTESIRASIAAFAVDSNGHEFPGTIAGWDALVAVCNKNGSVLKNSAALQGYQSFTYQGLDYTGAATTEKPSNYFFVFRLYDLPADLTGAQLEVRPSGIERQTFSP